jgi:NitT/TauT family transport system substrate-binding protein
MTFKGALGAGALVLAIAFIPGPSPRAADLAAVKVATLASDTGADVYYAREQGFFKAAGLDVQIDALTSGAAVITGVLSGSYDFGAANPVSIAAARIHGLPIETVAPGAVHTKGILVDALMVQQASPIKTARDLEGKTVAVTTIGGLGAVALQAWITKNGGNVKNVKFVEIPYPAMGPALQEGRVDAAQMTEPYITSSKAGLRPLIDAYDTIADRFLIDGWVSSEDWLAKHPNEARRFAAALRQAHDWANTHQAESAQILVKYTKLDPQIASTMVRTLYGTVLDVPVMQPVLDIAAKAGVVDRRLDAADVIWKPAK